METNTTIAILGAGNIGTSIASGLLASKTLSAEHMILTRRKLNLLKTFEEQHVQITDDNIQAVKQAKVILIAVEPQQINALLDEISASINHQEHIIISVVTGVSIKQIQSKLGNNVAIVRAMPNTAISIRESMTCLTSDKSDSPAIDIAKEIFNSLGSTLLIVRPLVSRKIRLSA